MDTADVDADVAPGALRHLAVQLAGARGADEVVALTTSPDKREAALALGADESST